MELLIQARSALRDALVRSRTEIGGLRETAQLINSVQPGLYRRLRSAEGYGIEAFSPDLGD